MFTYDNSIIHLGVARGHSLESTRTHGLAQSLTVEFPDARSAYFLLDDDVSVLLQDGNFERQADTLLKELQKETKSQDKVRGQKLPIVFVCWGTVGGILLKQVY